MRVKRKPCPNCGSKYAEMWCIFFGGRTWYADYTYGGTWRCWMREPTPEEMANTPWEEC